MQAIQISQPVPASALKPVTLPTPQPVAGHDVVQVKAFGVNESEVTSRKGESDGDFHYPRVLGIEGVGVISATAPDSPYQVGQQVAMMMGGLGRAIDGTYAEYCLVPYTAMIPFKTNLDWSLVGALPEMLQTAYGSLHVGLNLQAGDTVLVRGGSSTVGLMSIALGKMLGATVFATTRNPAKVAKLKALGAARVLIDDGKLAAQLPAGVDKALELVGTTTLFDTFATVRAGGRVCFTGGLAGGWEIAHFSPFMIPSGKTLTSYAGEARDLPAELFDRVLKAVAAHELEVPIAVPRPRAGRRSADESRVRPLCRQARGGAGELIEASTKARANHFIGAGLCVTQV